MKAKVFVEIVSQLFVLLFLYTGVMKIISHTTFINSLYKSPIFHEIALPVSIFIPILELILAIALLSWKWRQKGLILSSILMLLFTAYIFYILRYADNIPCSCGGIIKQMTWMQHFYFDIIFTILGSVAAIFNRKQTNKEYNNLRLSVTEQ